MDRSTILKIINNSTYTIKTSYSAVHGEQITIPDVLAGKTACVTTKDHLGFKGSEGTFTFTPDGTIHATDEPDSCCIKIHTACPLGSNNIFEVKNISPFITFVPRFGSSEPNVDPGWGHAKIDNGANPLAIQLTFTDITPKTNFSILTYNTHLFDGSMASIVNPIRKILYKDDDRADAIVNQIINVDPDVVCLQEVWGKNMQESIKNKLSKHYPCVCIIPDKGFEGLDWTAAGIGAIGCAVIGLALMAVPIVGILGVAAWGLGGFLAGLFGGSTVRNTVTNTSGLMVASKHLLWKPQFHMFTDCTDLEDKLAKKAAVAFTLRFAYSHTKYETITIGTLHAPTTPSDAYKASQIAANLTFGQRKFNGLLVGDFNLHKSKENEMTELYKIMASYDGTEVIDQKSQEIEETYTDWPAGNTLTKALGDTNSRGKDRIDFIFFSKAINGSDLVFANAQVFHDNNWKLPSEPSLDLSDHYPVWAIYSFINT